MTLQSDWAVRAWCRVLLLLLAQPVDPKVFIPSVSIGERLQQRRRDVRSVRFDLFLQHGPIANQNGALSASQRNCRAQARGRQLRLPLAVPNNEGAEALAFQIIERPPQIAGYARCRCIIPSDQESVGEAVLLDPLPRQ